MTGITPNAMFWRLVRRQHGVISREQLRRFRYNDKAIAWRVEKKRLFRLYQGVFAVGRPDVTREGEWMAAVLACGDQAKLGYGSGGAVLGIGRERGKIEIVIPYGREAEHKGIWVHHTRVMGDWGYSNGIPVRHPADVLVDMASYLDRDPLEAAVNAADRLDLIDPETLRERLDSMPRRQGKRLLGRILDIHTFVFTDSTLERMYLPLSDAAGLPRPETQRYIGSYRVDFIYWALKLVVETNGLRYHRTPQQQARDYERSQAHARTRWLASKRVR